MEESEVNFVELVHSLLEDPSERKYFFQVRVVARWKIPALLNRLSRLKQEYQVRLQVQISEDRYAQNRIKGNAKVSAEDMHCDPACTQVNNLE